VDNCKERNQNFLRKTQHFRDGIVIQLVPLAARSKAWVRGRSFAGIVGSNSAGVKYCVLSDGSLYDGLIHRPEESCRMWRVCP
jgi:hypothetical protein